MRLYYTATHDLEGVPLYWAMWGLTEEKEWAEQVAAATGSMCDKYLIPGVWCVYWDVNANEPNCHALIRGRMQEMKWAGLGPFNWSKHFTPELEGNAEDTNCYENPHEALDAFLDYQGL